VEKTQTDSLEMRRMRGLQPCEGLDKPSQGWASLVCLVVAMGLLLLFVLPGLRWGLPSETRNTLTMGPDRAQWKAPALPPGEAENPWEAYPNYTRPDVKRTGSHSRSAFNPVRSYHPDEYVILKSLSAMRPAEFKLFPGFFAWPALQFYVIGAALKVSGWLGLVKLVPDINFYFQNPNEMARLYMVGRVVTLLFGLGAILLAWMAGRKLLGEMGGGAAALLLAVTPLFAVNAHYLTADVPMLSWVLLTLFYSINIMQRGRRRDYVLAGVALGLAAATRYQGAFAAMLIFTAHMMRPCDEGGQNVVVGARHALPLRRTLRRLKALDLWLTAGVSILIFLSLNPYIFSRFPQFARELSDELRGSANPQSWALSTLLLVTAGIGIPFAMCVLGAAYLIVARKSREGLLILIGFGVPAVILLAGRPVMARYLMPVLPLAVFAVAWAFCLLQRRALTRTKPIARVIVPILLAALLLVAGWQTYSFCRLYSDPAADTRTLAGEEIARTVPDGATIGVLSSDGGDPWQFELPPLNQRRCRILLVPLDPAALEAARPEYFVCSDLQFPPLAVRGSLNEKEEQFRRTVLLGVGEYAVAHPAESWPVGWRALLTQGPHDMRYVNPLIVLSRRAGTEPK